MNFYVTEEKIARVEFGRFLPTFQRNMQPPSSCGHGGILKKKTVRDVWRPRDHSLLGGGAFPPTLQGRRPEWTGSVLS